MKDMRRVQDFCKNWQELDMKLRKSVIKRGNRTAKLEHIYSKLKLLLVPICSIPLGQKSCTSSTKRANYYC